MHTPSKNVKIIPTISKFPCKRLPHIKCYMKRLENEDCITDINGKMQCKKSLFYSFPLPFLYDVIVKHLVTDLSLSEMCD